MPLVAVLLLARAAEGVSLETPKGWSRSKDTQTRFASPLAYRGIS